jgi:hypothetical protein
MNSNSRTTNAQIKEINKDIDLLSKEVDDIEIKIQIQNDSISKLEIKNADLSNNDVAAEVGPLKYIARLTGKPMDEIINWFILALIFVFDPLAIALLIAANISMERASKQQDMSKPVQEPLEDIQPGEEQIPIEEIKDFFDTKKESEENFKKKIEEINKSKEVIEENVKEEVVAPTKEQIKEEEAPLSMDQKTFYMKLLAILFKNGELGVGDEIASYEQFIQDIRKERISYSEAVIRDFLIACNLVKAIDTSKGKRVVLKDYETSKELIKNI